MYRTIEQALNTKKAVILSEKDFTTDDGEKRVRITAKKEKGEKRFILIRYGNGLYSSATAI